jgi:hypothetical protein
MQALPVSTQEMAKVVFFGSNGAIDLCIIAKGIVHWRGL